MKNILIDLNILLDYYEYERRKIYPESVKAFDYLKNKDFAFISALTINNFRFIKYSYIKKAFPNLSKKDILNVIHKAIKEILSFFKLAKTPTYVEIDYDDIENSFLVASAKAINALILTRDKKLLNKYPNITICPKEFVERYIKEDGKTNIPMLDLNRETYYMYPKIEENIDKVINKSNFILGDEVKRFEERVANYIGTKYAIGVSSGTDALVLALRALAITRKKQEYWDRKDLIITTPFTFTATGDSILRSGATPLFVDIDPETYNIDHINIKQALKIYGDRIVGIIPVHLYGLPCYMDEIMEIAEEHGLFVVEDCAQAFGAKYKEKKVGSFGDAGCFSFFPSKNLGAFGDAGAITTNNEKLASIIKMLRVHGGKDKYNVDHIGYKARLDTLQAAVLLAKFEYIDEFNERRRKIAEQYSALLKDSKQIKIPFEYSGAYHVYHQYTIRITYSKRDILQKHLRENGIESFIYYPVPLNKMKVFISNGMEVCGSLENSEIAAKSVLSLPIEPLMETEDINKVYETLVKGLIVD